jgi:beta-glucosidase
VVAAAGVAALLSAANAAAVPGPCADPTGRPWCKASRSPAERARLLLDAMTPDEEISLLAGEQLPNTGQGGRPYQHSATSLGIERLPIPQLNFDNGPAGVRQGRATALPAPLALAATWSPALARKAGAVVGDEAKNMDNDFVYAPTVNIMRTPLGGRTFEGYGEDPFLDSSMTVDWIRGLQRQGVIGVVKHFAANNQEGYAGPAANTLSPKTTKRWLRAREGLVGDRRKVNVHVDQRTLHEIYFPQFEAAVRDADVGAVMCAKNKVNGTHACRNRTLLLRVLRREWGFHGILLSDHGAAEDTAASLRSGLDFDPFPGITYGPAAVNAALANGSVDMSDIRPHVFNILRTMFAYGVFDRRGYTNNPIRINAEAHARVAGRIEESAITLLRNRGRILPLDARKLRSIAVIGPGATQYAFGGGSSHVNPFFYTTPLDAITRAVPSSTEIRYADGSDPTQATAAASGAGVAIVFVRDYMSEGVDRACLTLECPSEFGNQDALIREVADANPRTIVVMQNGGPVLTPWRGDAKGLLEAWYPGEKGGTAIARVLFGKADPSGRLPVTFPRRPGDLPTTGNRPKLYPGVNDQVHYKEGVFVGYRWYDAKDRKPAFPFGFGLSYTRFRYNRLRVKPASGRHSVVARVSFRVVNAGDRKGVAVPELYLGLPSSRKLPEPPRELKGFDTLSLSPGATKTVTIPLRDDDFAHWAIGKNDWKVAAGCYRVQVGSSSRDLPLRARIARGRADCGPDAVAVTG